MAEETRSIIPIDIEDEMRGAYIDYSMSVIISRALPDVRDGLKPVHRRILYGMHELGVTASKPYLKCARIVGEVLGKYHPHGDSAVYDSLVRMAQDWSLRYTLIDGQGNYGSVDGDSPAAMRYTEARMERLTEEMLADLKKNTVDYQTNFDDSLKEPTVLPARLPNLLVNGAAGIAVGMATNMAPHNLTEVIDGIVHYIDNPECTVTDLMEHVKGPDFPTGASIFGLQGIKNALETGRGRIVIRAKATIEEIDNREAIIVTEIPYQVNKAAMIERTAQLISEKKIEGISDIRDESDRSGMRIVYELKRDAIANVVLNMLYKHTQLQSSFSVNNVALVKGRPETLNLRDMIHHYVEHRHEVVVRRTEYDLDEAEKRAHILLGYLIALDNLDEVIKLIRASRDADVAKDGLMKNFGLSELQAKAILEMRLQRLTGLEREKIQKEYDEVMARIAYFKELLGSREMRMGVIKEEMAELREKYGDERRTEIVHASDEIGIEDLIADEPMVITVSHQGYIKRTPLTEYRSQGRGGVGSKGAGSKEEDFNEHLFVASMHSYLLFFTDRGKVFWLKVYQVPEGSKTAKGRPIQNLLQIEREDSVRAVQAVKNLDDPDYLENNFLLFVTQQGTVKKTTLEAYSRPRQAGINAITINEDDRLLDVALTNGDNEIVLAKRSGKAVRFHESDIRSMGRGAAGVRGVALENDKDAVVGMVVLNNPDMQLLVISENGYGKRTPFEEYRLTGRGAKGVTTLNITEKTGGLVTMLGVLEGFDLMIINRSGITIRTRVSEVSSLGRATQGVRLIKLSKDDQISAVTVIEELEGVDEDLVEGEEGPIVEGETPEAQAPEETE